MTAKGRILLVAAVCAMAWLWLYPGQRGESVLVVETSPHTPAEASIPDKVPAAPASPAQDSTVGVSASSALTVDPASLRDVGDTLRHGDYTFVKVDRRDTEKNPEVSLLMEEWDRESLQFLRENLGLSASQLSAYVRASAEAFADYNRMSEAILRPVRKVYGSDIDFILEGEAQRQFDRSWEAYDHAVLEILGERGDQDFKAFRERFHSLAHDRLGFVPLFIR